MSPPIRAVGHSQALQDALSTGILQVSENPSPPHTHRDLQFPKSHNCHPHIFCGGLKFFMHLLRVLQLHFTMQNCVANYVSSCIMRKSH